MRMTLRHGKQRNLDEASKPALRPNRFWVALIFGLLVLGFGLATLIAAASEALSEIQARGETDGIATANSYALVLVILLAAIILATAFGIWKMIESDAHDLMGA
jgi:hypothetical protein